ncbi:hypothetical protein Enr13x_59520 [Stieleria neptunia]|uniref:Uncharacterized protein n=1 Tax=Stieleria neptunia TaxID=2527979 RepID=A0A518HYX4_9BACT|nr:hypothetical protein Enr13x_59520 [Stieleria neptunia]
MLCMPAVTHSVTYGSAVTHSVTYGSAVTHSVTYGSAVTHSVTYGAAVTQSVTYAGSRHAQRDLRRLLARDKMGPHLASPLSKMRRIVFPTEIPCSTIRRADRECPCPFYLASD